MFNDTKIYTVHVKPDEADARFKPVFIKEGFNFAAFIFTVPWAIYKRLWTVALMLFVPSLAVLLFLKMHYITHLTAIAIHLGIHFIAGSQGNDWIRSRLRKQGYVFSDVTAADSFLRAQQRYLERYLAPVANIQ